MAKAAAVTMAKAGAKKRASMIRSFGCCILILPRPTPQVNPGACASVHSPPCVRARVPGLTCTLPRGTVGDDQHKGVCHDSSPSLRRPCRRPRFGLGLFVVCALLASAAPLAAGLIPLPRCAPAAPPLRPRLPGALACRVSLLRLPRVVRGEVACAAWARHTSTPPGLATRFALAAPSCPRVPSGRACSAGRGALRGESCFSP